jgi:hypothetical protein
MLVFRDTAAIIGIAGGGIGLHTGDLGELNLFILIIISGLAGRNLGQTAARLRHCWRSTGANRRLDCSKEKCLSATSRQPLYSECGTSR